MGCGASSTSSNPAPAAETPVFYTYGTLAVPYGSPTPPLTSNQQQGVSVAPPKPANPAAVPPAPENAPEKKEKGGDRHRHRHRTGRDKEEKSDKSRGRSRRRPRTQEEEDARQARKEADKQARKAERKKKRQEARARKASRAEGQDKEPKALPAAGPEYHLELLERGMEGVDVTERGVEFGYLKYLVESGKVDGSWTIQETVEKFVRPSTRADRCCLFDIIPEEVTCEPHFFVSHTWSRPVSSLLGILSEHLESVAEELGYDDADHVPLWLDIVAINQHPYEDKGCLSNDDVASLHRVVARAESTLFCLDPGCVALTRIWCLFEIWQTFKAKGGSGLMLLMPAVDAAVLKRVFDTFDVMQGQATQPADKERILREVQEDIGSTNLNLQLKAALIASAKHEVSHTKASGTDLAVVLLKAADLITAYGRYGDAEPLYCQALQIRQQEYGMQDVETLAAMHGLASCRMLQARYSEAHGMFQELLEVRRAELGPEDPETIRTLDDVAGCVMAMGSGLNAANLFQQALELSREVLGEDHPDTMDRYEHFADCLIGIFSLNEAEPICRTAFEYRQRTLGPDHPKTISATNLLAKMLLARADTPGADPWQQVPLFQEAERVCNDALATCRRVRGEVHPDTLSCMLRLASVLQVQLKPADRKKEAGELYRKVLAARDALLGPDHIDTITSRLDYGWCLFLQRQLAAAEPHVRQAAAAAEKLYPNHPTTDRAKAVLARLDPNDPVNMLLQEKGLGFV